MNEDLKPFRYEPIALSNESTVVAEFLPDAPGVRDSTYQSEAALEKAFIEQLQIQAYDYLALSSEAELIANLRRQLEKLNKIGFADAEWERFFSTCIAGANDGILEKTARVQEDHIQVLKREDGTTKNIYLIDKANIHNNALQVINQYEADSSRATRFDVTVLVNGLPMVHIELKRRGVDIREAFNQINRFQRDSFWAGSGLFEYVQLFVISNGTLTKYYSNTVRDGHLKEQSSKRSKNQTSNSYSFTSWWADARNQPITELTGFAKTFFAKHSLLNVLTKYCVLRKGIPKPLFAQCTLRTLAVKDPASAPRRPSRAMFRGLDACWTSARSWNCLHAGAAGRFRHLAGVRRRRRAAHGISHRWLGACQTKSWFS